MQAAEWGVYWCDWLALKPSTPIYTHFFALFVPLYTARIYRHKKCKKSAPLYMCCIYGSVYRALAQLFRVRVTHSVPNANLHTHTHNRFTAVWNLSGTTQVSRYQKKHSPTHTHRGHQSSQSAFSIYYEPWHPPYSMHVLCSLFTQSLSNFSLVYLLAWYPPLHTPYISLPNHYLLFAAHAHTIATCSAVVLKLCFRICTQKAKISF